VPAGVGTAPPLLRPSHPHAAGSRRDGRASGRGRAAVRVLTALVLAACGQDRVADALAPVPEDPAAALAACDAIVFPELAVPCRVSVAASAAGRGDEPVAEQACGGLPEGPWPGECHFRIGEEMARAGNLAGALRHCGTAGLFARPCFTHAASLLAPDPSATGPTAPEVVVGDIDSALTEVKALLAEATWGDRAEALDGFRARLWFNAYFGTGHADPAAARLAPDALAPFARTAFALEAVRLLFPDAQSLPEGAVERVRAAWRGEAPVPAAEPLTADRRVGRYASPLPSSGEAGLPRVPVFGGAVRLVGAEPDEDLDIAILEALYFRTGTTADAFVPWLDDPRERVRWTAIRLFRRAPPGALDPGEILDRLKGSPDPVLRWHAFNALDDRGPRDGRQPQPGGPPGGGGPPARKGGTP